MHIFGGLTACSWQLYPCTMTEEEHIPFTVGSRLLPKEPRLEACAWWGTVVRTKKRVKAAKLIEPWRDMFVRWKGLICVYVYIRVWDKKGEESDCMKLKKKGTPKGGKTGFVWFLSLSASQAKIIMLNWAVTLHNTPGPSEGKIKLKRTHKPWMKSSQFYVCKTQNPFCLLWKYIKKKCVIYMKSLKDNVKASEIGRAI